MKKLSIALVCISILMTYACKKTKETEPEVDPPIASDVSNYSQLKVGNYWIYQEFKIDTNNIATPTTVFDSVYIEKDTLMWGNPCFKVVKPSSMGKRFYFLRNANDCIVDYDGIKLFSFSNFSTPLYSRVEVIPSTTDTIYKVVRKMTDKDLSVTVPAGTFITSNAQLTYNIYPKYASAGAIRYAHSRYAENVGLITETLPFYLSLGGYTELRLVRYHLN